MPFDYDRVRNWPIPVAEQTYRSRDTILYALGVGAATSNPVSDDDLKYVYEDGLEALPTLAVVLATGPFWMQDPETGIDWRKVLHGEQTMTIHKPLPPKGRVISRTRVDEIYDKGADKGAVLWMSRELCDTETGDLLATTGMSTMLRGNGGFGGTSAAAPKPHPLPADRPPDTVLDLMTRPEQAVLYRLSGDLNPLHIDPRLARQVGFERPILHGLCGYGIACRAILKLLCANQPARLRRLDVRFASPVYPGDTLRTEVWREGAGRAAFRLRAVERDLIVLTNGLAEFVE